MTQRSRDLVNGQITLDYFMRKAAEGWTLAAVEWVRETEKHAGETEPIEAGVGPEEVPYGVRAAGDSLRLEENPLETTVLLLILEKIVKEKRITEIADDLNQQGFKTRQGTPWSPSAVFDLMPRLIEVGPKLLKTAQWPDRRAGAYKPN